MMAGLWDAIVGLLGGGSSSSFLPNDPDHRRPQGYDPDAARWAQISRALLEAGARVASAPRGQATGQGLLGFIEGMDAGKQAYENGLRNKTDGLQFEDQQPQDGVPAAMRKGLQDAAAAGSRGENPSGFREQVGIKKQPAVRARANGAAIGAEGHFWTGPDGYEHQPILDPGSNGGGHGYERCMLIPELSQFGLCFYHCPDGAVIRGNAAHGPFGCAPFRFRGQGVGPDSDMV
jgi:hypothetical protein